MSVIDLVLVVIVAVVVVIETKRGFGKVIFDFAALLITIRGVSILTPNVAKSIHLAADAPANQATVFAILFVIVGAIALFIGKLAYDSTLISLDTFDPILGGVVGVGIAVIIGHAVVKTLAIAASIDGVPPEAIVQSKLGMEFYKFVTYYHVMSVLMSLGK